MSTAGRVLEKDQVKGRDGLLERVLVPLDGSELSARILTPVSRLIEKSPDAEVLLLRVLETETAEAGGDSRIRAAREEIANLAAILRGRGMRARGEVLEGDPAECIRAYASLSEASLVAMSTHGRTGPARWIRGSVAERVLRRSRVPVFLSNPIGLASGAGFRKILIPLDGSSTAAEILPLARTFARAHGAEIVLQGVVDLPRVEPLLHPLAASTEEAHEKLETYRKRLEGIPTAVVSEFGTPAAAILDRAADPKNEIDLVAMTTHGRSGISRWAFGSVAEKVLRHCACPLLVERVSV